MDKRLHIWITGASRGIGAAIADHLSANHNVTASARTATKQHNSLFSAPCDVTDPDSVRAAHDLAVTKFGPVNVLINNAGIGVFKAVEDSTLADFDSMVNTNLRGIYICTAIVLPSMIEHHEGMLIDINSISTLKAFPNNAIYAATKAGALAFGRSLREEVRSQGIKVIEVVVGATSTDIWDPTLRSQFQFRMMLPEDVAEVVADVVSKYDNDRLHLEGLLIRPQLGDL